ncbi:MAG: ornithine cyclodeaminase family protein [Gulosibacter sp.]|uniref:ornithine cyclodeaminase family protein n=1 Tax=Gulosibacter sp. TaxID=2817531 RepID=UPI003F92FA86
MTADPPSPTRFPLFLTDHDVRKLSDMPRAVDALRNAYSATLDNKGTPGRIFAETEVEWTRIMPSIPPSGRLFGAKSIVGSFADGLQVSYLISLFDKQTAQLVALVDGNSVTSLRTAATSAVGAEVLSSADPITVAVIGSGFEARSHLDAFAHVLNIHDARVFSPTTANRVSFAEEFTERLGVPVLAVASAEAAVRGADLVLCAARSRDESPTVQAEWIEPNATVISIGSTTPAQRELPVELLDRASVILVDTYDEVVGGSGDMLAATEAGFDLTDRVATLHEALCGDHPIDTNSGIRIYKSTGSGLQDIVVAEMLVDSANAKGLGTELPVNIITSRK